MDGDEIHRAVAVAFLEEILKPRKPVWRARDSRTTQFDPLLFQRLNLPYPSLGRKIGRDVATTIILAIGLIERENIFNIRPSFDLRSHVVEEGSIGRRGRIGGAEEHGHELQLSRVGISGRGRGLVVVVPSQVGRGRVPDAVVVGVFIGWDEDEPAFGRGASPLTACAGGNSQGGEEVSSSHCA